MSSSLSFAIDLTTLSDDDIDDDASPRKLLKKFNPKDKVVDFLNEHTDNQSDNDSMLSDNELITTEYSRELLLIHGFIRRVGIIFDIKILNLCITYYNDDDQLQTNVSSTNKQVDNLDVGDLLFGFSLGGFSDSGMDAKNDPELQRYNATTVSGPIFVDAQQLLKRKSSTNVNDQPLSINIDLSPKNHIKKDIKMCSTFNPSFYHIVSLGASPLKIKDIPITNSNKESFQCLQSTLPDLHNLYTHIIKKELENSQRQIRCANYKATRNVISNLMKNGGCKILQFMGHCVNPFELINNVNNDNEFEYSFYKDLITDSMIDSQDDYVLLECSDNIICGEWLNVNALKELFNPLLNDILILLSPQHIKITEIFKKIGYKRIIGIKTYNENIDQISVNINYWRVNTFIQRFYSAILDGESVQRSFQLATTDSQYNTTRVEQIQLVQRLVAARSSATSHQSLLSQHGYDTGTTATETNNTPQLIEQKSMDHELRYTLYIEDNDKFIVFNLDEYQQGYNLLDVGPSNNHTNWNDIVVLKPFIGRNQNLIELYNEICNNNIISCIGKKSDGRRSVILTLMNYLQQHYYFRDGVIIVDCTKEGRYKWCDFKDLMKHYLSQPHIVASDNLSYRKSHTHAHTASNFSMFQANLGNKKRSSASSRYLQQISSMNSALLYGSHQRKYTKPSDLTLRGINSGNTNNTNTPQKASHLTLHSVYSNNTPPKKQSHFTLHGAYSNKTVSPSNQFIPVTTFDEHPSNVTHRSLNTNHTYQYHQSSREKLKLHDDKSFPDIRVQNLKSLPFNPDQIILSQTKSVHYNEKKTPTDNTNTPQQPQQQQQQQQQHTPVLPDIPEAMIDILDYKINPQFCIILLNVESWGNDEPYLWMKEFGKFTKCKCIYTTDFDGIQQKIKLNNGNNNENTLSLLYKKIQTKEFEPNTFNTYHIKPLTKRELSVLFMNSITISKPSPYQFTVNDVEIHQGLQSIFKGKARNVKKVASFVCSNLLSNRPALLKLGEICAQLPSQWSNKVPQTPINPPSSFQPYVTAHAFHTRPKSNPIPPDLLNVPYLHDLSQINLMLSIIAKSQSATSSNTVIQTNTETLIRNAKNIDDLKALIEPRHYDPLKRMLLNSLPGQQATPVSVRNLYEDLEDDDFPDNFNIDDHPYIQDDNIDAHINIPGLNIIIPTKVSKRSISKRFSGIAFQSSMTASTFNGSPPPPPLDTYSSKGSVATPPSYNMVNPPNMPHLHHKATPIPRNTPIVTYPIAVTYQKSHTGTSLYYSQLGGAGAPLSPITSVTSEKPLSTKSSAFKSGSNIFFTNPDMNKVSNCNVNNINDNNDNNDGNKNDGVTYTSISPKKLNLVISTSKQLDDISGGANVSPVPMDDNDYNNNIDDDQYQLKSFNNNEKSDNWWRKDNSNQVDNNYHKPSQSRDMLASKKLVTGNKLLAQINKKNVKKKSTKKKKNKNKKNKKKKKKNKKKKSKSPNIIRKFSEPVKIREKTFPSVHNIQASTTDDLIHIVEANIS